MLLLLLMMLMLIMSSLVWITRLIVATVFIATNHTARSRSRRVLLITRSLSRWLLSVDIHVKTCLLLYIQYLLYVCSDVCNLRRKSLNLIGDFREREKEREKQYSAQSNLSRDEYMCSCVG